ncbi:Uncharacterised protein [[Flavobacterium] thermophilum]|nr:hypothetical protein GARCT_00711 [Geobacillus sp. 12AMOR1]WJQ14759.1 hypothetical protein QT238_04045 [Geobacillus stearothermophilus]STO36311.1 Uncharacterised protein [[Flavobacterium] thermophilum]
MFVQVSTIIDSNDGFRHIAFHAKPTKIFFVPSDDPLDGCSVLRQRRKIRVSKIDAATAF